MNCHVLKTINLRGSQSWQIYLTKKYSSGLLVQIFTRLMSSLEVWRINWYQVLRRKYHSARTPLWISPSTFLQDWIIVLNQYYQEKYVAGSLTQGLITQKMPQCLLFEIRKSGAVATGQSLRGGRHRALPCVRPANMQYLPFRVWIKQVRLTFGYCLAAAG